MNTPVGAVPTWAIVAANVGFWAVVHAGTGYLVHRLPADRLARDGWLHRPRPAERGGQVYVDVGIRRWKDRLPEAGALFTGGLTKRRLPSTGDAGLERFAVETRRAELGHWLALAAGPVSIAWNPPAGAVAMVTYGVAVNAPFIAIQRYNRLRVARILEARAARRGAADA